MSDIDPEDRHGNLSPVSRTRRGASPADRSGTPGSRIWVMMLIGIAIVGVVSQIGGSVSPACSRCFRTLSARRFGLGRGKRRLVAGRPLRGAERIGETLRRASGLERLLLARIGRPAAEIDDLERGAHPPVRPSRGARDKCLRRAQVPARKRRLASRQQHVAAAKRAHLAHQFARGGIVHRQGLRVGHGQRKARRAAAAPP